MRAILAALLAFGTILVLSPASAQSPTPDEGYSLQPATGNYLKIDRRTGDVSLCTPRGDAWSCQLIADDRRAYEDRIVELEAENERLAKQLAALKAEEHAAPLLGGDDERRLQEFFDLGDRMFRHFFDLVERLRERERAPI
ncbi:hypothetical protein ANOBCDAF_02500 [Pleomorphomonas sp. T1.2MG-36]|uniref:hypothetical protein n=1 Tax=Pleomorphomonas sp. T1.2MG-36 TaxID=3041167 RepID=UPI0024779546|nr:hypothetical protein [Pleomorphomonas sp. T1.2MG-36]CAI9411643.1 hypothetical protein ANOBCDAF_02500 [Pleomorphomonas sp. T1.2MG-36]